MSFLRSSLFIAIVSLLVLTGYGLDALGDCCAHHEPQGSAEHGENAPGTGDDCQCLCHQAISPFAVESVRLADRVFMPATFLALAEEFPPDAVPLGIDHPPQLA